MADSLDIYALYKVYHAFIDPTKADMAAHQKGVDGCLSYIIDLMEIVCRPKGKAKPLGIIRSGRITSDIPEVQEFATVLQKAMDERIRGTSRNPGSEMSRFDAM